MTDTLAALPAPERARLLRVAWFTTHHLVLDRQLPAPKDVWISPEQRCVMLGFADSDETQAWVGELGASRPLKTWGTWWAEHDGWRYALDTCRQVLPDPVTVIDLVNGATATVSTVPCGRCGHSQPQRCAGDFCMDCPQHTCSPRVLSKDAEALVRAVLTPDAELEVD